MGPSAIKEADRGRDRQNHRFSIGEILQPAEALISLRFRAWGGVSVPSDPNLLSLGQSDKLPPEKVPKALINDGPALPESQGRLLAYLEWAHTEVKGMAVSLPVLWENHAHSSGSTSGWSSVTSLRTMDRERVRTKPVVSLLT